MFSIFKKKVLIRHVEWLGVDVHSHLLPGIDDGSPTVEQSVKFISKLNSLGFKKLICTPHIFKELYPNTIETISSALEICINALKVARIDVEVSAAAEYMVDENFEVSDDLMCLPNKFVLVEMSYLNETPNIEEVIFDLQIKGYQVILAHPERYNFYHTDYSKFHRYQQMGVLLQLNLLSVTGYYGKEVKRAAEYLLENKCYDLAGSDLHHDKHLEALIKTIQSGSLYKKIGNYPFKNKQLFG